ncbi:hypothetical protein [Paenibacillus jiagnxiensis]|uniref:hypothetical protein n=1 Tax=Paenibacillus jiagnxiensis TaxID=3228926 RepID=UPI0033ADD0B0
MASSKSKTLLIGSILGLSFIIATGFVTVGNTNELPGNPKEAAVSTFTQYMDAAKQNDYKEMVELSEDSRFTTVKARINFLKDNQTVLDYEIDSVDSSDPSNVVVTATMKFADGELPPIEYNMAFENGKYKLQYRSVLVNLDGSVEYDAEVGPQNGYEEAYVK